MANLKEDNTWEQGIYQFETSDPVMGGPNGIDNLPTRQLANRTLWLKTELAAAVQSINTNQTSANNTYATKATTLTAGSGLTGGCLPVRGGAGCWPTPSRRDRSATCSRPFCS